MSHLLPINNILINKETNNEYQAHANKIKIQSNQVRNIIYTA